MNQEQIRRIADELGYAVQNLIVVSHAVTSQTLDYETMSGGLTFTVEKLNELYERLEAAAYPKK